MRDNLYFISGGELNERATWTGGNSMVLVGDKGVVLVDTMLPGAGPGILAQIKSVTDKPVTMIINTHTLRPHGQQYRVSRHGRVRRAPFIDFANSGGSAVEFGPTLQKAVAAIKNVDTVVDGHTFTPVTWNDFATYTDFHNDFLRNAQAAIFAGK